MPKVNVSLTRRSVSVLAVLLLGGVSVLIALIGGQTAAHGGDNPPRKQSQVPASTITTQAVADIKPEIHNNFRIFRENQAFAMPDKVAEQIASPERYGRNSQLARPFKTPLGAGWVTPGDGYICIAVPTTTGGFGSSCVPVDLAISKGLSVRLGGGFPDGKILETILPPDRSTVVKTADKSVLSAAEGNGGVVSQFIEGSLDEPGVQLSATK